MRSAVDQLASEDLEGLADETLCDDVVELEVAIGLLEAERARRLHRLVTRRGFGVDYPSASAFLIDRCRISPGRAARLVAQAQALAAMPDTARAYAEGRLSSDQARLLIFAHTTNPDPYQAQEAGLVEKVEGLGIVATKRIITYWREAVCGPGYERIQEELYARRRVYLSETFEGMGRLDGWLDPETYALLSTALDAVMGPRGVGDPRTRAQQRADALSDLARQALDWGRLPAQGGEKPHLLVIVDLRRLQGQREGVCETVDGTHLDPATLERLSCDAAISRIVFGPGSEPINLGRKTRIIPPALRRAVIARDRHCQHPGCPRPAKWCDIDHIIPWQAGGTTSLDNLQLLCRYHHTLKHQPATNRPAPYRPESLPPKPIHPKIHSPHGP